MTAMARDQLKAFIERVERLEEEKKALADDIRDVYAEAKAHGFDTRAMRVIVRKRKLDQEERLNQEQLVETYMVALGMGWGKSDANIDEALDRRRTDAGKAKTARGQRPPSPRAALARSRASSTRFGCASAAVITHSPAFKPHAGDEPPRPGPRHPGGADQHQRAPPPGRRR